MQDQGKATYVERISLPLYSLLLDFASALVLPTLHTSSIIM